MLSGSLLVINYGPNGRVGQIKIHLHENFKAAKLFALNMTASKERGGYYLHQRLTAFYVSHTAVQACRAPAQAKNSALVIARAFLEACR